MKYAKNSVVVYLEDFTDWTNLRRNFESGNLEFHTYATAEEKTHAFVVRGLHKNVSPDEIKKDLLDDYEISVKEVHLMKTMFQPLFLVVLDSTYTLKKLQSQVKNSVSQVSIMGTCCEKLQKKIPLLQVCGGGSNNRVQ